MDASPDSEVKILERLFPLLRSSLCVDEVRPFLVQNGTINFEQCEELQMGSRVISSMKLAEKVVIMVSRHPKCASQLLKALEATDTASVPDSSHHQLIAKLKMELGHQPVKALKDNGVQAGNSYYGILIYLYTCMYMHGSRLCVHGIAELMCKCACDHWNSKNAQLDSLLFPDVPLMEKQDEQVNPGASNEPVSLMSYKLLKEKGSSSDKLRVQLAVESRRILEHFASFCIRVGDVLQAKGVTTDRLRTLLQYRLGSKNIGELSMKHINEARTIHNLLCVAEPFASWFNYDLIAFLAKELGEEEGSAIVADYESKFQQYLQKLVFECPPFSSIKSIPSGFEELTVKLDWNFEHISIQDITIFKAKLCKFLGHSDPSVFILKSVEEGCVLLTWLVSSSIIVMEAEKSTAALLAVCENIIFIRVGPKMFDLQVSYPQS